MKAIAEQPTGTRLKQSEAGIQRPIFIHNMFRTGGTYLWSKFRNVETYRAYYEPLNEILARPEKDVRISVRNFIRNARHPKSEFYFAELPFQPDGGVEYFDESFSFESYALSVNSSNQPLRRYFGHLLAYSLAHQQTPVFKLDRGLLRTGWLTANFSPINVLVLRNPLDIWESFKSFGDDVYFRAVTCAILGRNRRHGILGSLADRYGLPQCRAINPTKAVQSYWQWTKDAGDALYPLFFEFYLLTTLHSARYADCILDMTGISSNPELKAAATHRLKELGVPISLKDCRVPSKEKPQSIRREINDIEQKCLQRLEGRLPDEFLVPRKRLELLEGSLSDSVRRILNKFKTAKPSRTLTEQSEPVPTPVLKEQARRLISTGRPAQGAEILSKVLQYKQGPELWNTWAKAQAESGHYISAAAGFRVSIELDPSRSATGKDLNRVLRKQQIAATRVAMKRAVTSRLPMQPLLRRLKNLSER